MLRRLSLGLLASAISITSLPVIAQEDRDDYPKLYITGAAGANNPTTRTNTGKVGTFEEYTNPGASAELGFGIDFEGLRIEATYAIDASQLRGYTNVRGIDFDYISGGEVRKQSAFISGYWDLLRKKSWTPYLGTGIGYSNLDVRNFSDPGLSYNAFNRSLWGYQFKAGMSVDVSSDSKIFAEGIYRATSHFNTKDGFNNWNNASWSSWGGQLGVRVAL
ncbi:outer membrane protein [Synechococcus sp. WH 8016]|uniref:outer membrane protein n=1 Tax=Synechococcus sp. WH 8016 TaxID=166318 RepID=UPI00022D9B6A|nr:P44/Msp2 family outer membrane protein [Synechococcus sp. WH 8016]EHA63047.1 hypothetical protein Syn8016DRAFT_0088 [Synechococcus sp. WH 8016]